MVPREELDLLAVTLADAWRNAQEGRASIGSRRLEHGLRAAERLEADGNRWGKDLAELWRKALNQFRASLPDPPGS